MGKKYNGSKQNNTQKYANNRNYTYKKGQQNAATPTGAQYQQNKKKISRSKAIQASKREQREASKMRNVYKKKIEAKEARKARMEKAFIEKQNTTIEKSTGVQSKPVTQPRTTVEQKPATQPKPVQEAGGITSRRQIFKSEQDIKAGAAQTMRNLLDPNYKPPEKKRGLVRDESIIEEQDTEYETIVRQQPVIITRQINSSFERTPETEASKAVKAGAAQTWKKFLEKGEEDKTEKRFFGKIRQYANKFIDMLKLQDDDDEIDYLEDDEDLDIEPDVEDKNPEKENTETPSLEQEEDKKETITSEKTPILNGIKTKLMNQLINGLTETPKPQEKESFRVRFTRKIKEKADSIRNKEYNPDEHKISRGRRRLIGLLSATALMEVIAIGTVSNMLNRNEQDGKDLTSVTPIELENIELGKTDIETKIENMMDSAEAGSNDTIELSAIQVKEQENAKVDYETIKLDTKDETDYIEEEEVIEDTNNTIKEDEEKIDYLSSVRVGTAMKINTGKFFETPEGEGRYGRFENYKDSIKEISMIEAITKDGFVVTTDSNISLYELKQQYPDAKFSFHIICRNQDGTTTTLGWLREDSQDKELDKAEDNINLLDIDEER